jgi:hypothetical protein
MAAACAMLCVDKHTSCSGLERAREEEIRRGERVRERERERERESERGPFG